VFELFQSCGGLIVCGGFYSVCEPDACDDLGQIIKGYPHVVFYSAYFLETYQYNQSQGENNLFFFNKGKKQGST